jgi:hypothetical protein
MLDRQRAQGSDGEGGDDRHQDRNRTVSLPEPKEAHERSEGGGRHHIAERRLEHKADAERQYGVASDALHRPESRPHGTDIVEPAEPIGRIDSRPLGLVNQTLQRRDLVEARRDQ